MSFIFFFGDRLYCAFDVELFASQPYGLTVMKMTFAIIATVLWLIHYVLMSWSNIERIFFFTLHLIRARQKCINLYADIMESGFIIKDEKPLEFFRTFLLQTG